MSRRRRTLRVSLPVALELLRLMHYVAPVRDHYAKKLVGACRAIRAVVISGPDDPIINSIICICGRPSKHRGAHEDVGGGVWW